MKVLLTGSKGMLAHAFFKKKPKEWELWATDVEELDITTLLQVEKSIQQFCPDLIINCAAYTRVDECETKKELAFAVNGAGPANLARAASRAGARLVHFSTDYIFDGTKGTPYIEEDQSNPLNVYGVSKLEGELHIRKNLENYLIIRTQWLYGEGGPNFVKTILELAKKRDEIKVVNDQWGCPTWTEDLVDTTLELIKKDCTGIYQVVNTGECSWYDFACQIIKEAELNTKVIPCTTAEFPRPAKRPAYSVLSTEKVEMLLRKHLSDWQIALRSFLNDLGY
ncbi:MAG: dTDP-4-dehydrorhamnose reductase [Nitrospiria bacterium]